MSINYDEWSLNKDITIKTPMNRGVFDNVYWNLLPQGLQLDRMVQLTDKLLDKEDEWASKEMETRRNKRKFIRPRSKTESMRK